MGKIIIYHSLYENICPRLNPRNYNIYGPFEAHLMFSVAYKYLAWPMN
jgi:hypothetical protein